MSGRRDDVLAVEVRDARRSGEVPEVDLPDRSEWADLEGRDR